MRVRYYYHIKFYIDIEKKKLTFGNKSYLLPNLNKYFIRKTLHNVYLIANEISSNYVPNLVKNWDIIKKYFIISLDVSDFQFLPP